MACFRTTVPRYGKPFACDPADTSARKNITLEHASEGAGLVAKIRANIHDPLPIAAEPRRVVPGTDRKLSTFRMPGSSVP